MRDRSKDRRVRETVTPTDKGRSPVAQIALGVLTLAIGLGLLVWILDVITLEQAAAAAREILDLDKTVSTPAVVFAIRSSGARRSESSTRLDY